jgi:biotin operon repressor
MDRAIQVRDGIVSVAEDIDVVVLEPGPHLVESQADRAPLRERVVAALAEQSPLSAAELEERLGVSRSTLNTATRELVEDGEIECTGQGRALRYSRAT